MEEGVSKQENKKNEEAEEILHKITGKKKIQAPVPQGNKMRLQADSIA